MTFSQVQVRRIDVRSTSHAAIPFLGVMAHDAA
jgi:hypothetical protein